MYAALIHTDSMWEPAKISVLQGSHASNLVLSDSYSLETVERTHKRSLCTTPGSRLFYAQDTLSMRLPM